MLGILRRLRPAVCQAALLQPAASQAAISQAAISQGSAQQLTSLVTAGSRGISGSPAARGLEEFFDTPGKDGQPPAAGENRLPLLTCFAVQGNRPSFWVDLSASEACECESSCDAVMAVCSATFDCDAL